MDLTGDKNDAENMDDEDIDDEDIDDDEEAERPPLFLDLLSRNQTGYHSLMEKNRELRQVIARQNQKMNEQKGKLSEYRQKFRNIAMFCNKQIQGHPL